MVVLAASLVVLPSAHADDDKGELRVGMVAALSGPSRHLGLNMKLGIEAYFARVNKTGGVHARPIRLLARDDGYEPDEAARPMRALVDDDRVLAVLGNVGTPTAQKTAPIAMEKKVLFFGAFTGADFLRKPSAGRYIVNYRASYTDETRQIIEHLLNNGIHPHEIAFFSQTDGYGDAGYRGAIKALHANGYEAAESLPHVRYERNTLNIEDSVLKLLYADVAPRAIVMIGTYAPCAKFIRMLRRRLPHTLFANVSFVGGTFLANELGANGEGVIVTQVVPSFTDDRRPLVRDYLDDLKALSPSATPSFVSLEGYIVAKILVAGLQRAKTPLTRESAIDGLLSLCQEDIGLGDDARVNYCGNPRNESSRVWPTMIEKGLFVPVDWKLLGARARADAP